MYRITDIEKINRYIEKYPINEKFSFDIMPYLSVATFEAGEYILREGSKPNEFYYMFEGRAKLYLTHKNGKISLINFLESPCYIGEMEMIKAQNYSDGVQALSLCRCFAISLNECVNYIVDDKKFLIDLCTFLGKKALRNTSNYTHNQAYPLDNRLAAFILITSNNNIYREKHTEAAEFLGVSYRHLLFVISKFCRTGLLERTDHGYMISNLSLLQKLRDAML